MSTSTTTADQAVTDPLPPDSVPYVLESGQGRAYLLLGEVGRTLAGGEQTNGQMSVLTCTGPSAPRPIPLHFHEAEHDLFYCVRGRMQVWCDGVSRVLGPGDFASVPPGAVHAYQLLDHSSMFMGPIVPAGWDTFFAFTGTPYDGPMYPPVDPSPPPFEKFAAAESKYHMTYVHDQPYAEATTGPDDALPGAEEPYFLRAGEGPRHAAFGQVAFQILTGAQTRDRLGMAVVEGPKGSVVPAHRHERTPEAIYVLDGLVRARVAGEEHLLARGDFLNVPAGTVHELTFERPLTRYATMNAPAGIERLHELCGRAAEHRIYSPVPEPADPAGLERAAAELDVVFA
ncbi:MAG TPA: quercetin 2,3-dioxygenase [Solirubrobacteraceae bacterium]|nr:quercetin 2,3-dioxygenase [Solirubrobacteraceae bacterium]